MIILQLGKIAPAATNLPVEGAELFRNKPQKNPAPRSGVFFE